MRRLQCPVCNPSGLLVSCQTVDWVCGGVVVSSGPSPLASLTVSEQGFGFLVSGGGQRLQLLPDIIIIIISFKSNFFTIFSLRREPSLTRTLKWPGCNRVQITCNTFSAYHVQHVVIRATWYEGTAQLLNLTELKSHIFELYFIG